MQVLSSIFHYHGVESSLFVDCFDLGNADDLLQLRVNVHFVKKSRPFCDPLTLDHQFSVRSLHLVNSSLLRFERYIVRVGKVEATNQSLLRQ